MTITLYASPNGPLASATVDTDPNVRLNYDIASAVTGGPLNAIPANMLVVLRQPSAVIAAMLHDHAASLDRLVSLLAVPGTQYVFDEVAYTVKPSADFNGGVVLTKALPKGSFAMVPQIMAVPFQDIMNIKDTPRVLQDDKPAFVFHEHDPEFTADGLPRGMSKYATAKARPFPKTSFWKTIAIHANLSLRPHPFEVKNELVFLDIALVAGMFSCTSDGEVVDQIYAEQARFFRTNIDNDTVSGGHPWFQQALDKLLCGLRVLFTLVQLAPTEFDKFRDQVEVCTHLLSLMLRRSGRELQEPGSTVCKTPAWFYKEVKDGDKAKEDRASKKRLAPDDSEPSKVAKTVPKVATKDSPKQPTRSTSADPPALVSAPPAGSKHAWWDFKANKWHYAK